MNKLLTALLGLSSGLLVSVLFFSDVGRQNARASTPDGELASAAQKVYVPHGK